MGDESGRIGFFNLSQARREAEKKKPGLTIGVSCLCFLIFVKVEPFTPTLSRFDYYPKHLKIQRIDHSLSASLLLYLPSFEKAKTCGDAPALLGADHNIVTP